MKEKIAMWYKHKIWTKSKVANAVKKNVITPEDYEEITGEVYVDV